MEELKDTLEDIMLILERMERLLARLDAFLMNGEI